MSYFLSTCALFGMLLLMAVLSAASTVRTSMSHDLSEIEARLHRFRVEGERRHLADFKLANAMHCLLFIVSLLWVDAFLVFGAVFVTWLGVDREHHR